MKIIEQKFNRANFIKRENRSFKGAEQMQPQLEQPIKPSGWEKTVKGFVSFAIPGVGQFFDKRNKTGWLHLGLFIGLFVLKSIVAKKMAKSFFDEKNINTNNINNYINISNFFSFLNLGLKIGSCVDAVVNCGKQEAKD